MRRPEILAPAGDDAALAAALAAGADAIYFGLDDGWNARARAANFSLARLPEVVARIHRGGARAYVTLNTLVFEAELPALERIVRGVAAAGVDAIIVQDPAVALLARAVCPALEVHASTQMTVSSAEGARIAARLGATRVVVPRELSVDEIAAFAAASPIDLEVFIHGALCVSWSGQCLTSESFGGRSANRGQCAQSCRLPYDLVVDGEVRDLGEVRYLLSPQDLAGAAAVPALMAAGVASLKIEGRQKGPAYVATAVLGYRRWRDGVLSGAPDEAALAGDLAAMGLAYSRGGSLGFLGGIDHQRLVVGLAPKHRGLYLGRVVARGERAVEVAHDEGVDGADGGRPWTGGLGLAARPDGPEGERTTAVEAARPAAVAPRPGLGVVFDDGHPEADETGGPIFRVDELAAGRWLLGFGQPGPALDRVPIGARVWITSDPAIHRAADKAVASEPEGRIPLTLILTGAAGGPLTVTARAVATDGRICEAVATSSGALAPSTGSGLDAALVGAKLATFGGSRFRLGGVDLGGLGAALHLPVSELKTLRRRLVDELAARLDRVERTLAPGSVIEAVRAEAWGALRLRAPVDEVDARAALRMNGTSDRGGGGAGAGVVVPLCRTDAQLDAVLAAGAGEVELDWMELVGLGKAVARARAAGARVVIATPRVQKPGEDKIVAHLRKLAPDAILVRSWAALATLTEGALADERPRLHGDFSLNLTNSISAGFALGLGLDTATVAHDLDEVQLDALVAACPPARLAVTIHHHIPTFHTEHCVYAHLLSAGRDFRTCGRPCEQHEVALRDRTGLPHPVVVDVGCRNTVFHAQAQTAAALVPDLVARGVGRLRLELVRETAAEAARLYRAYRDLAAGTTSAADVVRAARAHEQFGVTRSLRVIT